MQAKLHRVSQASAGATYSLGGDGYERNVRDYILFGKAAFSHFSSAKDNTGAKTFQS